MHYILVIFSYNLLIHLFGIGQTQAYHSDCYEYKRYNDYHNYYNYGLKGYCVPSERCCRTHHKNYVKGTCNKGICCTDKVICQDCDYGYRKVNSSCVDINECIETYGVCSGHNCNNTDGGYECECLENFELIGDLKTCKYSNSKEMIDFLYSTFLSINLMPFNTTNAILIESDIKMLYSGTVFPKSIDYSFIGNYMAWTDISVKRMTIAPINFKNPSLIMNIKVIRDVMKSNKLSIDWIHDLIYWTDLEAINVINIHNTEDYYTIIKQKDNFPNDLIVNVLDSCLIWTYIDIQSRIMRANQDGTNIKQFYATFKHPFHLTIDIFLKRYFFIDIEDSTLYSIDFKGKDERKHFQSKKLLIGINSAVIYGDNIYLISNSQFFSLNKFGHDFNETLSVVSSMLQSTNKQAIFKNQQIFDFKILDPILQPQLENKCQNAKCSHLCLPSDESKVRCLCPHKYFLVNNTICIQKKQFSVNENIDIGSAHHMSTNTLQNNTKDGQQVILILILVAIITILIILIIIGFKLKLFLIKPKIKYSSQMKSLYQKTDDNSLEEIESKT